MDADKLVERMADVICVDHEIYHPTQDMLDMGPMLFGLNPDTENSIQALMSNLLNATLTSSLSSYSLWSTTGSQMIAPVFFSCQGLPPISGIASMLDGQWQQRHWKIPFNLILE